MPAKLNRVFAVGQHKAEHHLNSMWESFGAVGENTVRMETTGTGMKIRITDGWDYPVDEARITLICLGLSLIHI